MKKFNFNGENYNPCDGMMKLVRGDNGHPIGISLPINCRMSEPTKEFCSGAIYRWDKKKDSLAYISYCPVCGENIKPR